MQALRDKFKEHQNQIKNDILLLGESPAAEKWGQKATLAWHEYCTELCGDQPFHYVTEALTKSNDDLLKDVALEIINQVLHLSLENKKLKEILSEQERGYEIRDQQRKLQTIKLLDKVRSQ